MIQLRPTQDFLKNRFDYNTETGNFIYKIPVAQMRPGDIAGAINTNGHIQIMIKEVLYLAHNLAWVYMTGEWPEGFIIDHIDRNYSNNRWKNFRKANFSQNQGNRKFHILNTSGFRGVSYDKKKDKYYSQICINGKKKWIGYFKTAEDAYSAYLDCAKKHFGEFYHD